MAVGDVWILGAGSSVEEGIPLFREFKEAAREVAFGAGNATEREALERVLKFWDDRLPTLNVEQLFGFLESPELGEVTRVGDTRTLWKDTMFLIAKVITQTAGVKISTLHKLFIDNHLLDAGDVITLNWDITLDRAIIDVGRKVEYALGRSGEWNPRDSSSRSYVVMKLHGSLNWAYCSECDLVTYLDDKQPAPAFILSGAGVECSKCGSSANLRILVVPPVLAKLSASYKPLLHVWKNAYTVLRDSRRVFIAGYSFPDSDLQFRLFLNKALRESHRLEEIYVVTKPKVGSARLQFEDSYTKMLEGCDADDKIRFEYSSFGKIVRTRLPS